MVALKEATSTRHKSVVDEQYSAVLDRDTVEHR